MTVLDVRRDPEALTITVTAEFAAPRDRVWQLYADPRQLERWWGPPEWPATFERHEIVPGGVATYYMTGPDGEKAPGWWRFLTVDPRRASRSRTASAPAPRRRRRAWPSCGWPCGSTRRRTGPA